MTEGLPDGVGPDDEIALVWERAEDGTTRVTAELGGASITVVTDEESSDLVPWLVASMPQILETAWAAIDQPQDTDQQEAP